MNKVLFTSYKCEKEDKIIQSILKDWEILNPAYKILYFSDKDIEKFFKETTYFNTFKQMKNGVAIADFFRICYINKYGGYWFDIDLPPTKIDPPKHGNIHLFDLGYKNISYMFIGGKPNQKLFNDVIIKVNKNILDNIKHKKAHVKKITGPIIIQNIIYNKLNIKNEKGSLPCSNIPKLYLQNTDYEFIYKRSNIADAYPHHKILRYHKLQNKYHRLQYQHYNYI